MSAHQKTDSAQFPSGGLDMSWMTVSACSRTHDLPWTSHGYIARRQINQMRDLCRVCPVLSTCARFVDEAGITAGFWAGMSRSPKKQRRRELTLVADDTQGAA